MINPIVLCGGSGTRLWPLSRESFPKQFVPLIGGKTLLQLTLDRLVPLAAPIVCVGNDEHRFLVREALDASQAQSAIQILEPVGRNTAPAITCAALNAAEEALLLFLPADHFIPDAKLFCQTILGGAAAARQGYIVTFGIQPSSPSTAYGYIQCGLPLRQEDLDPPLFKVARFVEKPPLLEAQQMLLTGGHYWNAGIFLARADTILNAMQCHAPDILAACREAVARQTKDGAFVRLEPQAFTACRSESIDYAVLEKHDKVVMLPFQGVWSDVGSWSAVANLTTPDANGNRISGQGRVLGATNTYVNAPYRPVVALGTRNLLIVDTPDALLVADEGAAEQVKQVVAVLKSEHAEEATTHRRVARPWGWYDCVDRGDNHQVKRIGVNPGASLSLQLHHRRAEHWVVVSGVAEVTIGENVVVLNKNQSTYIPMGVKHRLVNRGADTLEIIEIQSGAYLGEDDIVRFEDSYGRIPVSEIAESNASK